MIVSDNDNNNTSMKTKKLIVFALGDNVNHRHHIKSAIENSFDTYRRSLTQVMKSMDENIEYMKEYDDNNIELKAIHNRFRKDVSEIPSLWEENENFLKLLLSTTELNIMYGISATSSITSFESNFKKNKSSKNNESSINKLSSYDSLENILLHLHRDWSNDDCITTHLSLLISKVDNALQMLDKSKTDIKVLIPGAGLGRIGIELSSLGYYVEMNECSPTMITSINNIINELLIHDNEYSYYPYLHATLNDAWDYSIRNEPIHFPPFNIDRLKTWAKEGQNLLHLQYGDFVTNYKIHERKNYFDIIVTSYFIDTGNILDYLDVMKYILKPNGIWINYGPLHYHSASTVKYSYNQLLQIITLLGFEVISQNHIEGPYGCNKDINMKPDYYIVPLDVFQLKESIVTLSNNDSDDEVNWKSQNFSML